MELNLTLNKDGITSGMLLLNKDCILHGHCHSLEICRVTLSDFTELSC